MNVLVEMYDGYQKSIIMNGLSGSDLLNVANNSQAEGIKNLRFKDASGLSKDVEFVFDADALYADYKTGSGFGGNGAYKNVKVIAERR